MRDRALDLREAETRLTALARSVEYHIDGSVRSVAALLEEAADRIDPTTGLDASLEKWFSARLASFPEVRNLVITDARGHVVAVIARPGQVLPSHADDLSDRAYFRDAKAAFPKTRFFLPDPVVSRFSNQPSIPLTRSITAKNGGFGGVVIAGVDPGSFRDQLSSVMVDPEGGASLFRTDGVYYARVPQHDEYLGKTVAASPMYPLMSKSPNGVVRFVSMVNGMEKLSAYRTLNNFPLVVAVAETTDVAMSRWRKQVVEEGTVLVGVAIFLMVLAWMYDVRAAANRNLTRQLAASRDALEAQVAERTANLAATNAELEQFAYVASHDLQEPLRNISSFLQLLERRYHGQLDGDADEYIQFAVDGSKRMSKLINDVLDFSRIGRDDVGAEPCDAHGIAHAAVRALNAMVAEANATVTIGPLPRVWCRPSELHSVFQNLIGNAVKYRDPQRPPVITVSAERDANGMVRFAVNDNGIGIEPQYHDRIFALFQRLHRRDCYDGTGIGLALCRKIVERHGGRIWVESVPGQGTTMLFTLKPA
ncbi:MAG TPA: ATP-binding protein [Magnetospirillum sp.]|nr:ATP-binding protein [Magnetospirillum sp.]